MTMMIKIRKTDPWNHYSAERTVPLRPVLWLTNCLRPLYCTVLFFLTSLNISAMNQKSFVFLVLYFLVLMVSASLAAPPRQTRGLMYARLGSGLLHGAKDRQGAYEQVRRNKSNRMVVRSFPFSPLKEYHSDSKV